jgi:hypothetical protein
MLEGKTKKIQLWILKEQESLENIKQFLYKHYHEKVDDSDINLHYRWVPVQGNNNEAEFEILEYEIDHEKIKCLLAYAELEFLRVRKDEVSRTPRDIAVGIYRSTVFFVETGGPIRVLVASSTSYFSKVRTKLFKKGQKQWGELSYKDINLDREFFYWLMNKKGHEIKLGTEIYNLYDLDAFDCATERDQHQYSGTGQGIDREAPVGAMVSLSNLFTGLGIRLGNKDNIIKFSLSNNLETEISFLDSHILTDKGFDFFKRPELVLKIYFQIIPGLIKAYNNQRETWPQDEIEFRRYVAIRAISEIMNETGLTIQDIRSYLERTN